MYSKIKFRVNFNVLGANCRYSIQMLNSYTNSSILGGQYYSFRSGGSIGDLPGNVLVQNG